MATLGEFLRETREKKGLKLENISKATRIHLRYLNALEADDFDIFSAEAYLKGFLVAYARKLGIDQKTILDKYYEVRPDKTPLPLKVNVERDTESVEIKTKNTPTKPIIDFNKKQVQHAGIGVIMVTVLMILIFFGDKLIPTMQQQDVNEPGTVATPTDSIIIAEEDSITSSMDTLQIQAPSLPDDDPNKLSLVIDAIDTTWLKLQIDEDPLTEEMLLRPGERIQRKADEKFILNIGNAGGIKLNFDGTIIDSLGPPGGVVSNYVLKKPNSN